MFKKHNDVVCASIVSGTAKKESILLLILPSFVLIVMLSKPSID